MEPELEFSAPFDQIADQIAKRRSDWEPSALLRAKSIAKTQAYQLELSGLGLLPIIQSAVHRKLDKLLGDLVDEGLASPETMDHRTLFRLVFRLLAAKVFEDRGDNPWKPGAAAREVVLGIGEFYGQPDDTLKGLAGHRVTERLWQRTRDSFLFHNVSVDALAFVYETTLVSRDTRKAYGTHGTPQAVADFMVDRLPVEGLSQADRKVFEPFSGHAVFLTAALRRLKELLPSDWTPSQSHRYLRARLSGVDLDTFAVEVGKLCLVLADYPNKDGWRIEENDAWLDNRLQKGAARAQIVLCNPPFEDFTTSERARYAPASVHKPGEVLTQLLNARPSMLGIVLPLSVIDGRGYRDIRLRLGKSYDTLDILRLPEVFQHSDAEAVCVLAHGHTKSSRVMISSAEVRGRPHDLHESIGNAKWLTHEEPLVDATDLRLLLPLLDEVWHSLRGTPRLADVAELHRGIEFNRPLKDHRSELISDLRRAGFQPGLDKVSEQLSCLAITAARFLNVTPAVQRGNAFRVGWEKPKVILNAATVTRGPWRLLAAPDHDGLFATQRFTGVWPSTGLSLNLLAAVLTGPVANAFVYARSGKRDNQIRVLEEIPFPDLNALSVERVGQLVGTYRETRDNDALLELDAEILKGYRLHPRHERELLDLFQGHSRPGTAGGFDGFYPAGFTPALPLHVILETRSKWKGPEDLLSRIQPLDSHAVLEALKAFEPSDD